MSVQVQTQLARNVYFAGNLVTGMVTVNVMAPMQFHSLRAEITGTEWCKVRYAVSVPYETQDAQGNTVTRYRTEHHDTENTTTFYRQSITLAGLSEAQGQSMAFPCGPGQYGYPLQAMLPCGLPPTSMQDTADLDFIIKYQLNVVCDLAGTDYDPVSPAVFTVLQPIPKQQHDMAAPYFAEKDLALDCCCPCCPCLDSGTLHLTCGASRTVIALDTDGAGVGGYISLDNTAGEDPINGVTFVLYNIVHGQCNGKSASSRKEVGKLELNERCEAGAKKENISGVFKLSPFANATFSSPNVKSEYMIVVKASVDAMMTIDPSMSFSAIVGHTVDQMNLSPPVQTNQYGQVFLLPPVSYAPPVSTMPSGWQANTIQYQAPPQQLPPWTPPPQEQIIEQEPGAFFGGGNSEVIME